LAGSTDDTAAYAQRVVERLFSTTLPYVLDSAASFGCAGFNGRAMTDNVMNVMNVMLSLQTNTPIDNGATVASTNILDEFPYFGAPYADPADCGALIGGHILQLSAAPASPHHQVGADRESSGDSYVQFLSGQVPGTSGPTVDHAGVHDGEPDVMGAPGVQRVHELFESCTMLALGHGSSLDWTRPGAQRLPEAFRPRARKL
jgi:hypothetical protein